MSALKGSAAPRSRMLHHPGRFRPIRIQCGQAAFGAHFRLLLSPGSSLYDGLVQPLSALGVTSASTTILGGAMAELQYCVAPPDPAKRAVIAYGAPIPAGPGHLIFGNATLGSSVIGQPLVHCHAVIRDCAGAIRGGHILTEQSIVGAQPISVLVTAFEGFTLRQAHDPETNIALLQPFMDADNV